MDAVMIAFASGKGGTGKSTLAVLVGAALAALEKQVLVVELAQGLRNVDIMAGVTERAVFDLADVMAGRAEPEAAVVESPLYPGLWVLPAAYEMAQLPGWNLRGLYMALRGKFDYILLDVASGSEPAFAAAAEVAHKMLLVLTPEPVALRDGRLLADRMEGRQAQTRLVLNRVDPPRVLEDGLLSDLDEAIDTVAVQLIGVVPESGNIHRAVGAGKALQQKCLAGRAIQAIAKRITGQDVPLVVQ